MKTLGTSTHLYGPRALAVPDRIVVATDLTDIEYLMPQAEAQARASGAKLTLIHVIPRFESIPSDASVIPYVDEIDAAASDHQARLILEGIAAQLRDKDVACDLVIQYGYPRDIIPELVSKIGATRLLLGTHGRRHLKKLFLGSVAHQLIQTVDVPVCTVGPHARMNEPNGIPRKILHPVSLTNGFEQSARVAMEIAQFYRADITLLHVLDRGLHREYESSRVVEWTRSELQRLVPSEASLWTFTSTQVEAGRAAEQILNVAEEMNADLIVLGVRADLAFWPISGDATAYDILLRSKCPVLTLRHSVPLKPSGEQHEHGDCLIKSGHRQREVRSACSRVRS
jgi:nucleotide-binding universal stress UspA family protein